MKKLCFIILSLYTIPIVSFPQTKKVKVYLLGTFHFAQIDTLVYDVKDEKHQKSIKKLTAIIADQKPEKVFIEKMPEWEHKNKIDSLYKEYVKGNLGESRNEIWQIGARVASALKHSTILQCDHPGMYGLIYPKVKNYANTHDQQGTLAFSASGTTRPETSRINNDSLKKSSDLLEYIRWMNSEKVQATSHAHYINVYTQIGNKDVFHYDSTSLIGVNLTTDWYRRNIFIYSKILAQINYNENAIFVLIGNDHVPILKQLFSNNPFFEVVETESWLGKSKITI